MKYVLAVAAVLALLLCGCYLLKPYPVNFGDRQVFVRGSEAEAQAAIASFNAQAHPFRAETWKFKMADGATLGALYLRRIHPKALLVYFQGGGSSSWGTLDLAASAFQDVPVDVLIYDYRGSGLTGGLPDAGKVVDDVKVLIDDAKRRLPTGVPIVYYGVSMGTLFAGDLARRVKPDGLILDSAITTVDQLVRGQIPWFVRPFSSVRIGAGLAAFTNLGGWGQTSMPVLLLVGERDRLTPAKFSRAIYDRLDGKDCAIVATVAGVGHAEALASAGGKRAVAAFVNRVIAGPKCAAK